MTTRRATRPIDPMAVAGANKDFYAAHPELKKDGKPLALSPTDPAQAGLRKEWMDQYVRHGGGVKRTGPAEVQAARHHAELKFSSVLPGSAVVTCGRRSGLPKVIGSTGFPGVGTALATPLFRRDSGAPLQHVISSTRFTGVGVALATPLFRLNSGAPLQTDVVCKLVKVDVTCSHGRKPGPTGILMVVPKGDDGPDSPLIARAPSEDLVSCVATLVGGCQQHQHWTLRNGERKAGARVTIAATAAAIWSPLGGLRWKDLKPEIYEASYGGCEGGPLVYRIEAYPSGKVTWKIDIDKIFDFVEKVKKSTPLLDPSLIRWPLVEDEDDAPSVSELRQQRSANYKRLDAEEAAKGRKRGQSTKFLIGKVEYTGAWKEVAAGEPDNWQAYYEETLSIGFDPLAELRWKFQVFPASVVPPWLAQRLHLGIFLEVRFTWRVRTAVTRRRWPAKALEEWKSWDVNSRAGGTFILSGELALASSNIIEAVLAAEVGVYVEVKRDASIEGGQYSDGLSAWCDGLKCKATLKAIYGIIEYQREWQVFERHYWVKDERLEKIFDRIVESVGQA